MTLKIGCKSPTASKERIRNKRKEIASERNRIRKLRSKPFITFTLNVKPLYDAIKSVEKAFKKMSQSIQKIFPLSPMFKLYLQLKSADNSRPNKYLKGWGRAPLGDLK